MDVYFISGLGADKRAFERIKLPANYSIHHLSWIPPLKGETLNSYAVRLAELIDTTKPFALVGLSMGGMIATAMHRFLHPQKTILISSVGSVTEFPPLLRFARFSKVYRLIPVSVLRQPNAIVKWLFGAKTRNEKKLLDYFISHTDPHFIKWAIDAIVNWKKEPRPQDLFHIHGDADKMLPVKYTHPDVVINKGSHFMVWTRAGEVSRVLVEVLSCSEVA